MKKKAKPKVEKRKEIQRNNFQLSFVYSTVFLIIKSMSEFHFFPDSGKESKRGF